MPEPGIIIEDDGSAIIVPGEVLVVVQDSSGATLVPGEEMLVISDRGPPGAPGAGDFTHVQSVAATEWIVNHNKGLRPNVSIRSVGGVEVDAQVVHMTDNQLRIFFNSAFSGTVRCI